MAVVLLPGLLATEAGGRKEFDVDAATVGDALRALPVRDLLLDESGAVRPLVNVFVDGERARDLASAVGADTRIRIVAAIAGGSGTAAIWESVDRLVDRAPGVDALLAHKIHLFAARRLRALGRDVPAELVDEEELASIASLAAVPVLERARAAVDGRMALLKGPEVALLYPDPALRPLRDLDLLVDDAPRAHAALRAAGFTTLEWDAGHPELHHLPGLQLPELPLIVEVHSRPKWPKALDRPAAQTFLDRAVASRTGVEGVLAPAPADAVMLLAAHSWAHLPLRRILDLVDVAVSAETVDRGELDARAAELGLGRVWSTTIAATEVLLGARGRTWPLRTFARYVPDARERTVAESHLESVLSPFAALPLPRAAATAARAVAGAAMPDPGQTWREKLTRARRVVARPLEPKSLHDRELERRRG